MSDRILLAQAQTGRLGGSSSGLLATCCGLGGTAALTAACSTLAMCCTIANTIALRMCCFTVADNGHGYRWTYTAALLLREGHLRAVVCLSSIKWIGNESAANMMHQQFYCAGGDVTSKRFCRVFEFPMQLVLQTGHGFCVPLCFPPRLLPTWLCHVSYQKSVLSRPAIVQRSKLFPTVCHLHECAFPNELLGSQQGLRALF